MDNNKFITENWPKLLRGIDYELKRPADPKWMADIFCDLFNDIDHFEANQVHTTALLSFDGTPLYQIDFNATDCKFVGIPQGLDKEVIAVVAYYVLLAVEQYEDLTRDRYE